MIQEYIPGDIDCHGYYNSEKNVNVTFTGRKLRSYPNDAGSTAVGLSVDNGALRCASETPEGGCLLGHYRHGLALGPARPVKILDCNPRVGQNFRMFENNAGIDVVRAQHLDLTGRDIDDVAPIESRLFNVKSFYLLALLRGLPRGAPKQGSSEYFSAGEGSWLGGATTIPRHSSLCAPGYSRGFWGGIGVLQKPAALKFAVVAPAFTSGHGSERAQIAVANGRSKWQSAV